MEGAALVEGLAQVRGAALVQEAWLSVGHDTKAQSKTLFSRTGEKPLKQLAQQI